MSERTGERRGGVVGGVILITIGLVIFIGQIVNYEWVAMLIPAALGVIFMVAGIVTRSSGLMIPGGILGGIGVGTVLTATSLGSRIPLIGETADDGGLFMIAFGLGWYAITLMTAIFTKETHWWALIPGTIILLIGFGLTLGGVFIDMLELAGRYWPLLLIIAGIVIIARQLLGPGEPAGEKESFVKK